MPNIITVEGTWGPEGGATPRNHAPAALRTFCEPEPVFFYSRAFSPNFMTLEFKLFYLE